MAVSQRLRYEILRRDNHACRYCGATAPDVKLNVDHVIPQALGGSDDPTNLATACAACNGGKTSSMPNAMPVADVDQQALRQAAAQRVAAAEQRKAVSAHLFATWLWAWERVAMPGPDSADRLDFAEELAELLDRGLSARLDLTEIVFETGSDHAIDPGTYLPVEYLTVEELALRQPLTDDEAERSSGAYAAWWSGWEQSSPSLPRGKVDRAFFRDLRRAVSSGHQRVEICHAAYSAGLALSPDLAARLSQSETVGGEI